MNKDEKWRQILAAMTPEQRKEAEAKQKARELKKQQQLEETEAEKEQIEEAKRRETSLLQQTLAIKAKVNDLKELSYRITGITLGREIDQASVLNDLGQLLNIENYEKFRELAIDVIRAAFHIRTPHITHPVKTAAANFLDKIMTEQHIVELSLILPLLTEGYISKTLAKILTDHAELIIEAGYGEFVLRFVRDIKNRNGNLDEDGSVSPFTPEQKKRVYDLFEIYRSSIADRTIDEWHKS